MVLGRKPALRLLLALLAQLGAAIGGRTEIPFGRGWRWHRGDAPDGPGLGSGALSGFHNVTSCTNTHKMDGWAPQGDKSAGYPPGVTSCGIACSYDDSCTAFSDGHGYCAHGFADSVCNGTGGPRAHVMQRGPGVGFQRNFSFAATDFDDSGWKLATLPHDPLINQTFDPAAGEGSGFVPRKVIWYRKAFVLPEEWGGQHIFLRFDGAFQFSEVYLNGAHLQDHSTGYVSWTCRLDNATSLSPGKNILAIRVDPSFGSGHWCAPAALKTARVSACCFPGSEARLCSDRNGSDPQNHTILVL